MALALKKFSTKLRDAVNIDIAIERKMNEWSPESFNNAL